MATKSEYYFLLVFSVAIFSAPEAVAMDVYTTSETATDNDFCPGESMEFLEDEDFLVSVLVSECSSHLHTGGPSTGSAGLQLKGPFFSPDLPLSVAFNVTFWEDYCRLSPEVVECFRNAVRNCRHLPATAEILTKRAFSAIWRQTSFFPEPVYDGWACEGPQISDRLRAKYSAADHLSLCCDARCKNQVDKCLTSWHQELEQVEDHVANNSLQLELLARSTFWCVLTLLPPGECNAHHRELLLFAVNQSMPFNIQSFVRTETFHVNSPELVYDIKTQTNPATETVAVYGSSHVITANASQHTTCASATDEVELLKNYFIDVSGKTNQQLSPVHDDTPRPINELTVLFYNVDRKLVAEYRTACQNLSNTFYDEKGNNITTDEGESWSVEELVENESVVIRSPVSGTLFVRCWRAHLSVVARLPSLLLKHSTGLLVAGCPANSVANSSDPSPEEHCLADCRSGVSELFQQTCVYECENTRSSQVVDFLRGVISDIESAEKVDITSGLAQFHFNYNSGAQSSNDWKESTTAKTGNGVAAVAAAATSCVLINIVLPILLYLLGANASF